MYVLIAALAAEELSEETIDKIVYSMFWVMLTLLGGVVGYAIGNIAWCIGISLFFIVIGLCIIFWIRDNKKNIKENESN